MRAVAKRLVGGLPAAAQRDRGAARQAKFIALLIVNRELAFDADRSVVNRSDFCHLPDSSMPVACQYHENCPIQDDPERRIGFQYKMILKTGGILRVNDHPNGECRRPELRRWKPCWKPARRCGSPQKGERRSTRGGGR